MIKPKEKNADGKLYIDSKGLELVCVRKDNRFVYLVYKDKNLIDLEIENANELPIGTRCVGKVCDISKDINAAFVMLPDKNKAFLKNGGNLKCEMNIPVEIIRSSSKGKLISVKSTDDDIEHRSDLSIISYGKRAYEKLFDTYQFDKVLTDDDVLFDTLKNFLSSSPYVLDLSCLKRYNDSMVGLSVLYSVSQRIKEASSKTVWLKSGANLIIEETSAFTVIDINSAKSGNSDNLSYLDINLEACDEIFRQMNLRNLSGIILIDFINLKKNEEKILIEKINNLAKFQKNYTKLVDITPLGIAELTRKKEGCTLSDIN